VQSFCGAKLLISIGAAADTKDDAICDSQAGIAINHIVLGARNNPAGVDY
jgi:hypothetical protein